MYADMVQMTVSSIVANVQKTPSIKALTLEIGEEVMLIFIDPVLIKD